MRLVTFAVATPVGAVRRVGAEIAGGHIVDLAGAYAAYLESNRLSSNAQGVTAALIPADMVAFLDNGPVAMEAARRGLDAVQECLAGGKEIPGVPDDAAIVFAPTEVRLLAPLPRPRTIRDFLCFEEHQRQAMRALGRGSEIPEVWYRVPAYYKGNPSMVAGPDDDVVWPSYCAKFDYELEIAAVIGLRGRDIPVEEAEQYIAGYTIYNDFSARDTQVPEMQLGLGPGKAKDFEGSNAFGPALVTPDEVNVRDLSMVARVNGEIWSSGNSGTMYRTFADLIAHISRDETLYPGDVLGSGTVGSGSGLELDRWLQPGDVIDLEIQGIGVLRNTIVRRDG
jgi:2-keto-4-pentenoate hydratase/2-oxohepta-3-ene-1,7-dioic acid hydratase in catechol pathway